MRVGSRFTVAGWFVPALVVTGLSAAGSDTRLVDAVKKADKAAARALVQQRADVNAAGPDGSTPLHWAVHLNDIDTATMLIRAGANVKATNWYGVPPLNLACVNGNAQIVVALIEGGADPNSKLPEGETVLMTAARNGNAEVVKLLLEKGADPNAKEGWRQQTALMWAAAENNTSAAKILVEHGAAIGARSGVAPAGMPAPTTARPAAARPGADAEERPDDSGFMRARTRGGFTPFLFAVRAGHIETARYLLDAGASVSDALPDGNSALHLAVMNAQYDLGAMLLERGADPNDERPGWTSLHQMAWTRRPNIGYANPSPVQTGAMDSLAFTQLLIDYGANVDAREKREPRDGNRNRMHRAGATPFLLAAKGTDVELMHLLADNGADPLLPINEGTTPLMAAAGVGIFIQGESPGTEAEAFAAVKAAFEIGGSRVNINTIDANGNTALHGAVLRGANDIVRWLVEKGAKIDITNRVGWTPLTVATGVFWPNTMNRYPKTAALLRELGAREEGEDRCPQDPAIDCFVSSAKR